MDKKIANNIILGIFLLLGLVAFVYLLFNVGNGKGLFSNQFILYAKFSDVKGLHHGSEVSLSGLRVGAVRRIFVMEGEGKELKVELSIDRDIVKWIRQDSVAMIRTQGVLGDKYVEISIGTGDVPVLEEGALIKSGDEVGIFEKGGNLVETVTKLAQNLEAITSDIRRQKKALLHEFIYGDSGKKLNQSLSRIESILTKIDKGEGTLGALVNDPTVYEDLKQLFGGAKRSSVLQYFIKKTIEDTDKE